MFFVMITELVVVYSDKSDIKRIEDACSTPSILSFINSTTDKKKAFSLKSYWGAKLDPFAIALDGDKPVKAFYSEEGKDTVREIINYIKSEIV